MERTTVYLDGGLKRRLKSEAARRGTTEASLLREALAQYLSTDKRRARKLKPVGKSKDGGVAHRADEALAELHFGER
jgi:predicted transcriptional regulator